MSLLRQARAGLRSLLRKDTVERELDDELRHYFELATQEHMRAGMSRPEAERAARVQLGGIAAAKEHVRTGHWEASLTGLAQDLRYAVRGLRRSPAFAAVAAATLALGVGANTAMFSVVNAVMLRPLPYREPGKLALIFTDDVRRGLHQERTAFRTIADWRGANRTFQDIAYFNTSRSTLIDGAERTRARIALASANLFPVLGVPPLRGRAITVDDEEKRAPVAVISHSLWQRRFAGASDVIGRTVTIEGGAIKDGAGTLTIIGVMPVSFYFPDKQTDIWTPATTYWRFTRESAERFPDWARRWTAVGRLAPPSSIADAAADLARVGRTLAATYASTVPDFPGFAANVVPMLDSVAGSGLQSALWVLLGAVGLVLLIACANIANLLLARGAARQREFAIRRALGAARARLVRQLIAESIVLAALGGAVGLAIAVWGTRALAATIAQRVPRIDEISVDARVLLFATMVSLAAGLVFGLVPALRVSAADPGEALKAHGERAGGGRLRRNGAWIVLAECSLAIVLLTGAGLLLRSLSLLQSVQPGFDPQNVLTVRVEFPSESPPTAEERKQTSLIAPARARAREASLKETIARLSALPGVDDVGVIDDLFITGGGNESITIPGRPPETLPSGELNQGDVSPGFFRTMRVPLQRGRYLSFEDAEQKIRALWSQVITDMSLADKERLATPEPVVVNEAFGRRYFPGEDPIGKRFCIDPTNKTYWYVIVGVVGDMHRQGLEHAMIPQYFGAYLPSPNARADVVVRTARDPLSIAPAVRQALTAAIPSVVIAGVSTASAQLGDFTAQRRLQTWLLSAFAFLALVLAAVGVYGLVHYTVVDRTREIGVRIALGASPGDVLALVIGQGMRIPLLGVALGLAVSLLVTRVLSHLLYGLTATDPITFAAVAVTLAAVAAAACWLPARRATRVDPIAAVRSE